MILRGVDNLRRCAWIGERDSAEEREEEEEGETRLNEEVEMLEREPSKEVERTPLNSTRIKETLQPLLVDDVDDEGQNDSLTIDDLELPSLGINMTDFAAYEDESEERRQTLQQLLQRAIKMSKSKKEILRILHSVGRGSDRPIPKRLRKIMGGSSDEMNTSPERPRPTPLSKKPRRNENDTESPSETVKLRLTRSVSQDIDENDGAFEVFEEGELLEDETNPKLRDSVEGQIKGHIFYPEGLKFERGKFNQTNKGDQSDEEHYSSYSSSEEALASCQGVIMTLPLVAFRSCSYRWTEINKITYDIPVTGTYYFVYSSDNEIDSNKLYLNMTFEKVVYNVNESDIVCVNATDCSVPLPFFSKKKAVVEVPQESTWDKSYVLETTCEPRVAVYLSFLLLVPILILFCAFQ